MKLSSLLLVGLTLIVVGPSQVRGSEFDNLVGLISELETEAQELSAANDAKDVEIASLLAKLEEYEEGDGCDGGGGDGDGGGGDGGGGDGDSDEGWTPSLGDSWNYNLETPVRTSIDVDVFLIDMDYAQDTIDELHDLGKVVVCYISIGTVEDWRDDANDFPAEAIGSDLDDWDGEAWLDINNQVVKDIMAARVQKAMGMGCDGIEPDNMMVYTEPNTGVSVTKQEQIAYNTWIAETIQATGMKVALKNAVEIAADLVDYFDFAVNEECNQWNECDVYTDNFLKHGKPVFNVEYQNNMDMCDYTNALGMDTIIKNYNLKSFLCSCVDPSRDWKCQDKVL
eukprot:jgi/Undpi1/8227/HiC_scaffold_25.g10697.m1